MPAKKKRPQAMDVFLYKPNQRMKVDKYLMLRFKDLTSQLLEARIKMI